MMMKNSKTRQGPKASRRDAGTVSSDSTRAMKRKEHMKRGDKGKAYDVISIMLIRF